ncbi:unnamed protein product [Parnassius apollo]|uniref:(apollo) hypothetical protein n=1 Tax=Parnassius apollo TaxID=110799 RepID=A0A8S3Y740_PARAO|nr:unnamed protein product [Parnassius apollo]
MSLKCPPKTRMRKRFLVLTRKALIYYDSDNQRRKERGRIPTCTIHTVEHAQLGELSKQIPDEEGEKSPSYRYPFQVSYSENGTDYTLYLVAGDHSERLRWIHAIRTVCVANARRARYHPAAWCARRWGCCQDERRAAPGCALATFWPLPEPELDLIVPAGDASRMYMLFLLCLHSQHHHVKTKCFSYLAMDAMFEIFALR